MTVMVAENGNLNKKEWEKELPTDLNVFLRIHTKCRRIVPDDFTSYDTRNRLGIASILLYITISIITAK
jgi:hypothetical protein